MPDLLVGRHELQFAGAELAGGVQQPVGRSGLGRIQEADDFFGAGPVAGQQPGDAGGVAAGRHVGLDPALDAVLAVREPGAAADGELRRRDLPFHAELGQDVVAQVLGQGPERGPLAADEAEDGPARRRTAFDPVVPADESGLGGVMLRKRAHTGEGVDDLFPVHRDVREHVPDEVKEVVDFRLGADGVLGHVGVDVGGADQDAVPHRIDQHDPAVGVLEEDFAAVARREQLRVVQHDVRTLGSAHERRRRAHGLVGQVDPGAGGVHDDVGGEVEHFAAQLVAQLDRRAGCRCRSVAPVRTHRDERDVVAGPGVAVRAAGLLAVLEHIEGEPLGVVDGGVEVGGRVFDPGVQAGQLGQGALASAELVARNRAAVAGEEVVHAQAELDQERAALGVLALLVGQEAHRGGQDCRRRC